MRSIEEKRQREKLLVSQMITLYCRKKHHSRNGLCPECEKLDTYAKLRNDKCPFLLSTGNAEKNS